MVANLTYRTDDIGRWGSGAGADLTAVTIDLNFWTLFSAVQALEDDPATGRGIDFIELVGGNKLFVHLTDHSVQGPFTVPTSIWNPRGSFFPGTVYSPLDVVSANGALYIVNVQHTAAGTFNANANDGLGHDLYTLLLATPQNEIPTDGTVGQRLVKKSGSPLSMQWENDLIRLCSFIGGQPDPSELVLQYGVTDNMVFPAGLAGSVAHSGIAAAVASTFNIFKDGSSIGSITFAPSPLVSVSFPAPVACVPGNVITMQAPSVQDASLSNISFTLLAELTA